MLETLTARRMRCMAAKQKTIARSPAHLKVSETVIGTSPRKFLEMMIFPLRSMMNRAEATILPVARATVAGSLLQPPSCKCPSPLLHAAQRLMHTTNTPPPRQPPAAPSKRELFRLGSWEGTDAASRDEECSEQRIGRSASSGYRVGG